MSIRREAGALDGSQGRAAAGFDNERGVTLLEVLIAVIVLAAGFFGTGAMIAAFVQKNSDSKNVTAAVTLIQDKIENLKNMTYANIDAAACTTESNITATGAANGFYTRVCSVTTGTNTKTITVTVSWEFNGQTKSKSMVTVIGN